MDSSTHRHTVSREQYTVFTPVKQAGLWGQVSSEALLVKQKIKVNMHHDKQVWCDNLTRLRISIFLLVVLLFQLRVGPGP